MIESNEYRELCRRDFATFAQRAFIELYPDEQLDWNWHQDVIIDRLDPLRRGTARRLLVLVPPRSLKSFICSVALPAFMLGRVPSIKIVAVSYAQPLADDLARLCHELMTSAWYKSVFKTRLVRSKQPADNFRTTRGGYRMATSVGGTLTGRGADFVIIDDPIKAEDAMSAAARISILNWFRNTLRSRLNHKARGRILVVMQRLHQDDLAGTLIEEGWPTLTLPAIAPENEAYHYTTILGPQITRRAPGEPLHPDREPLETLEELRRDMGAFSFSAQYLQDPQPQDGNLIRRDWVVRYDVRDRPETARIVQSWDTASKTSELNDFSVCTTWAATRDNHYYLLGVLRRRMTYPELKRAVAEQAALYGAEAVLIEDKSSGTSLVQDLHQDGFGRAVAVPPKGEKAMRLFQVSALFENGFVHIPSSGPGVEEYVQELLAFPGKFDDQVDSTTQALLWLRDAGAEPAILRYYREKVQAKQAEQARPVCLQSPNKSYAQVILIDGKMQNTDSAGVIVLPEVDARPLRLAGWRDCAQARSAPNEPPMPCSAMQITPVGPGTKCQDR